VSAKKNFQFYLKIISVVIFSILIVSCFPQQDIQPTSEVQSAYLTVAAQTLEVLPTSTEVELPTLTPTPATPTATPKSCYDNILFVADVTIPDGKQIQAGETFTKIWRMKNNGTCTISPAYDIFFFQGDIMGAPEEQKLVKIQVPPGGTFDVTVDFTAPAEAGHYRGYWLIRDIHGIDIGLSGNESFYVDINVIANPNLTPTSSVPSSTPIPPTQDPNLPSATPQPTFTPTLTLTPVPTLTPTQSIEPELVIQSAVLMPQTVRNGDIVTLVVVVENLGKTASPAFNVKWYADSSATRLGCDLPAQGIQPSGYIVLNCAYLINEIPIGTLNTVLVIDTLDQVKEPNEDNNQKSIQITVVE
jgi:hypothetical protein